MAKKYSYNPESLSFDIITTSAKEKLKKWGMMFAASIVIAVVYFLVYSHFYDTPKEVTLNSKLAELKFKYQILTHDLANIDMLLSDIQKRDDDIYRTILESQPIPSSIRQAGFGGVNRYEPLEGYINSSIMIAASKHTDKILKQLYVQSVSYDELIEKTINKELMASCRPAIMPISRKDLTNVGQYKLNRLHPVYKYVRPHTGMDFSAKAGTPIHATGDGKVVISEYSKGGYGWMVVIDHGLVGYHSLYGHMLKPGLPVGTEVKRGQLIGYVGSTGLSSGPHVHYEVHKGGYRNHVNPIHYIYHEMSDEEYFNLVEDAQNSDAVFDDWNELTLDNDDKLPIDEPSVDESQENDETINE